MTDALVLPSNNVVLNKIFEEKNDTVDVLKNKMNLTKFQLLKQYLEIEKINIPNDLSTIEEILEYTSKNLSADQHSYVVAIKEKIENSIETMLKDLEKGSTTAFSAKFKQLTESLKPIGLAVAKPLAIRAALRLLVPPHFQIFAGVGMLAYKTIKFVKDNKKRTIANQDYELSKIIREFEITKNSDGTIVDTRFSPEIQTIIRNFLKQKKIKFEDTGYISLSNIIYGLEFEDKKALCNIINNNLGNPIDVNARLKKYDGTFWQKLKNSFTPLTTATGYALDLANNVNDIPLLRGPISTLLTSLGITTVTGNVENGLITAAAKTGVETAANFFNIGEDVVESVNSTINTVGFLGIFSAIGVVGSVGGMIFKYIKGKKERNKIKKDLEKIKEIDNKLYKNDIETELSLVKKKALEHPDLAKVMIVSLVSEYMSSLGVQLPSNITNANDLVAYINTLDNDIKNKVLQFYDDLVYYNKNNHNKFVRTALNVCNVIGSMTIYGLAGLSLIDMFSEVGILNDKNIFVKNEEKVVEVEVQEPIDYEYKMFTDIDYPNFDSASTPYIENFTSDEINSMSNNELYGHLRMIFARGGIYKSDGSLVPYNSVDFSEQAEELATHHTQLFYGALDKMSPERKIDFITWFNKLNNKEIKFDNGSALVDATKITNHDDVGNMLRNYLGYSKQHSQFLSNVGNVSLNLAVPIVAVENLSNLNTQKTINDAKSAFITPTDYDYYLQNLENVELDDNSKGLGR